MGSSDARFSRVLLRGVLREARAFDAAVRARGAAVNLPRELARIERCLQRPLLQPCGGETPTATLAAARAFRRELAGGAADVDVAFAAIRRLAARRAQLQRPGWQPKPAHVLLSVGDIFRHKRWGFRGVIVDWHASCPAEEPWPTRHGPFEDGLTQPFYRTLVCTRDRPNPFMTLAAAENLLAVRDDSVDASRPVEHPMIDKLFDGFRGGRHMIAPSNWDAYSEDF